MELYSGKVYYVNGKFLKEAEAPEAIRNRADAYQGTIAYGILRQHNTIETKQKAPMKIRFDALASHDITYVGIIQTAKASGLKQFPIPYVLTNCHNSLCAVGGTINEDDHVFGLSAAKKYGGIYVPPHQAVIHTYMRENFASCGSMILGSDSHTRYGALGTMAIGEGGPELVKQILSKTYDIQYPEVIAVQLIGEVAQGVGPQDVALNIIKAVFASGFVKNKVMEFVGPGIRNLPIEFRNGIDVMTTETTCLSSIWETDEKTQEYFITHKRPEAYRALRPQEGAQYDGVITVDLSKIRASIALPFHPSNVYTIEELTRNPMDILLEAEKKANEQLDGEVKLCLTDKVQNGKIWVQQGIVAGCAGGTYDNIAEVADILRGHSIGYNAFTMSVYPSSQPVYMELIRNGRIADLLEAGVTVKTAFCGPCFGAGDVPSNNALSVRHTTRNFPQREGSKPASGQIASVALMDARSIAATAANGGMLTSAETFAYTPDIPTYHFDEKIYNHRVYKGYRNPQYGELHYGPNIADWPKQIALQKNILLRMCSVIHDPVTTTDELIPSGETSSYRSNPLKLAEFTLSRKDPKYVSRAKAVQVEECHRQNAEDLGGDFKAALQCVNASAADTEIGSVIYANKPGDGSAREQAASCQRVLGGLANVAFEYATKRYRSNLINWGMLPLLSNESDFEMDDFLFIPDVQKRIESGETSFPCSVIRNGKVVKEMTLRMDALTPDEKKIVLAGCLMNFYKQQNESESN